jgi:hypothetical protein
MTPAPAGIVLARMFCASLPASRRAASRAGDARKLVLCRPVARRAHMVRPWVRWTGWRLLSHLRRGYRQPRRSRGVQSVRLRRLREPAFRAPRRCASTDGSRAARPARERPGAGLWDLPGGFLHEDELPSTRSGARCARRRASSSSCSTSSPLARAVRRPHRALPRVDRARERRRARGGRSRRGPVVRAARACAAGRACVRALPGGC